MITLIGAWSIFWAGYNPEEPEQRDNNQEKIENSIEGVEDEKNSEKDNQSKNEITRDGKKEDENKNQQIDKKIRVEKFELVDNIINCNYKIKGIPSPKAIKFRPKSDEFWVTSLMNKNYAVAVFDNSTGELIKKINFPDGGGVEITFTDDGETAFVSQMETGRVFQIDTETKEITKILETNSEWTKVLALNKNENLLFASNWVGSDISKISLNTDRVEKFKTVANPRGLYLEDNTLYVAGFSEGEVIKHDLVSESSHKLISTGGAMRSIVGADKHLYVSDMAGGRVYRINKDDDRVEEFVETDNNPNSLAITDDNKILVVSNRGINNKKNYNIPGPEWGTILFYDLKSGEKLNALVVGNQPTGLDINGELFAYSNFLDGEVVVCNLPSYDKFLTNDKNNLKSYKEKIFK